MKNNHSFYILAIAMLAIVAGGSACKRSVSPEEAARIAQQRMKDSTDSADSAFDAQTADMLLADKEVKAHRDSLHRISMLARRAATAENKVKADWLSTVFRSYIAGLNSQAQVQLGNAAPQVAQQVAQLTADAARSQQPPKKAAKTDTARTTPQQGVRYTFDRAVPQGQDWFIVTWWAGRKRLSKNFHLVKANPGYTIDQVRATASKFCFD